MTCWSATTCGSEGAFGNLCCRGTPSATDQRLRCNSDVSGPAAHGRVKRRQRVPTALDEQSPILSLRTPPPLATAQGERHASTVLSYRGQGLVGQLDTATTPRRGNAITFHWGCGPLAPFRSRACIRRTATPMVTRKTGSWSPTNPDSTTAGVRDYYALLQLRPRVHPADPCYNRESELHPHSACGGLPPREPGVAQRSCS